MEFVHVQLILHPKHNQQAARHSQSKTQDVYQGECLIVKKISPRYFKIVFYHKKSFELLVNG